jgi:uncharacterized membrane protein
VDQRQADVAAIYSDTVPFAAVEPLLQRYGVSLIYVGELERAIYPPKGLAKFRRAARNGEIDVIYQTEGITIYSYSASQASVR